MNDNNNEVSIDNSLKIKGEENNNKIEINELKIISFHNDSLKSKVNNLLKETKDEPKKKETESFRHNENIISIMSSIIVIIIKFLK